MSEPLDAWLADLVGRPLGDPAPYRRALTHASHGEESYQRLEFLGDRVLGLSIAEWLYELYPAEPEGVLSRRINMLVSGATCAAIAREVGLPDRLRLGKGVPAVMKDSDNVLGDVVEALLGALYLEAGFGAARDWVRRLWASRVRGDEAARKHPKAELQDWALAHQRGLPVYAAVDEAGPDHIPVHTVSVRVGERSATATASTKREAEAAAARALMDAILAEPPKKRAAGGRPRAILPARAGGRP